MTSFTPGDPLPSAAELNELAASLSSSSSPLLPAPGLAIQGLPGGPAIGRRRRKPILAVLSRTGNPYDFVQRIESAAGTLVAGPRTGCCYEVNGIPNLNGKIVRLIPDRHGSWRFQWLAYGSASCLGQICFTIKDCDTTTSVAGATITITLIP